MNLSKHDQRILSILIEERDKLTSQPKAYKHADAVMKLNKSIVGIRNTATCESMVESPVEHVLQAGKTVLMQKGDSIVLRAW